MTDAIQFDPIRLPEAAQALRGEVRAFLRDEIAAGTFDPSGGASSAAFDAGFSRRVGARGWIGMTWPKRYGGGERSFLERYVVTEEFRVANAPVGLHFTADRQSGPILLRHASERIKADILPRITRGECCFCIGMSEPGSGSDLFAASTRAVRCDGGWRVTGTKVWTTGAHRADYMIGLFRTSLRTAEDRRHGLTQFLVDMRTPGIAVHPIHDMSGRREFDEVMFDDAVMPDEHVLGEIDLAWKQATSELAYERSGPERFLETSYLLFALVRLLASATSNTRSWAELQVSAELADAGPRDATRGGVNGPALPDQRGRESPLLIDSRSCEGVGRLVAQLHALRRMSVSVAGMLEAGKEPTLEGSIVKDVGTVWQQTLPPRARDLAAFVDPAADRAAFDALLDYATLAAPKLTIQGGTTEILRGIIARGLGLR